MNFWADVSEWQTGVTDAYPHRLICIRSNDGTYTDRKWANNYGWCIRQTDAGALDAFLVYMVYRQNWQQTLATFKAQVGNPHPKMVAMVDVESWGGQIAGNQSAGINALIDGLAAFLGDRRRVIAYGNRGDLDNLWPSKPADTRLIVAGYSATKPSYRNMIGWQYTDGQGYGPVGWPQGAAPFGNCDMNYTDLSTTDFAAACGITTGGIMAALNDAEQKELLAKVRWIAEQLGPNIWGPDSSMGKTADGKSELTVRDGLAALKRSVETLAKKLGA